VAGLEASGAEARNGRLTAESGSDRLTVLFSMGSMEMQ
jgi:hypothetical protein